MKTAILVAMDKELELLLHQIDDMQTVDIEGINVSVGRIGNHDVIASKCGIGKVNAALNTHRIIKYFNPELVINTGVAGGAGGAIHIGQLLVADRIAYHDVWCGPGTIEGQADNNPLFFKSYAPVIEAADKYLDKDKTVIGLICTGDRFISNHDEVDEIRRNFPDVKAVDMESAAIAHTCHTENVPVAIMRVVSDTPGEGENLDQYKNFWKDAPHTTFEALTNILKML